jgi:TonB-linked SusC/RagA family outer membrane protein
MNKNAIGGIYIPNNYKYFVKIMRISLFFIFLPVLSMYAADGYAQTGEAKFTLNLKSTIKEATKEIEKNSNYVFVFSDNVDHIANKQIDLDINADNIENVLNSMLAETNATYHIVGNQIVIYESGESASARTVERSVSEMGGVKVSDNQQQIERRVTGTVTDQATGEAIIGANILQVGTTNGTVTDIDGNFILSVPSNARFRVSSIGYVTQEIAVPDSNNPVMRILLAEDAELLDEIVVIGYGTRARGALTGAISRTDSRVFETRTVSNAVNALQGALPGVTVLRGTTRPGADNMSILIRGFGSMNGSEPLILIDGIASDLNLINPNDIADITVLKDASASIYGARASNGVILVTTKRGVAGKPRIAYSGNYGVKIPHFLTDIATTSQMIDMYQESKGNLGRPLAPQSVVDKIKAGNAPPDPNGGWLEGYTTFPGFFGDHDWFGMMIGNGTRQGHNVSIQGGGADNIYLFSAGYNRDEGFFKYGNQSASNRYNLSANNSFKNLFNRLDIDTRIQYDSRRTEEPTQTTATLEHLTKIWRFLPMRNPAGNLYMWEGFQNPASLLQDGGNRYIRNDVFTFNARATLNIVDGLKLTTQYGVIMTQNETKSEHPTYVNYNWENNPQRTSNNPNSVEYSTTYRRFSSLKAYLDYNITLADRHHFSIMTGSEHDEQITDGKDITGRNLLSNEIFTVNLADKTDIKFLDANTTASDWAITSFFGRVGYNFDSKYLIDATLRADGSSRFAPSRRWSAVFPAVSAAWSIGNEEFIRSLNIFNNLKVRLSWGQSGNQSGISNYGYIPLITLNTTVYPFGSPAVNSTGATSSLASESRTWETVTVKNVGLDYAILRSRLSGSIELYMKTNSNMLVAQELPALLGASAPTQNLGELETKGFDLMIRWSDRIGDFRYGISAMLSDSQNKLVSLKGSNSPGEGLRSFVEGYPINSYFGYVSDGIIKTQEQLDEYRKKIQSGSLVPANINIGDMMYRDIDGDGRITAFGDEAHSGDLVYLGNRMPRYTYSSNIDLSYKNIDFSVFFQGVGKRHVVRTGDFRAPFWNRWFQPLAYFHGKTWTIDRPDAQIPRIIEGGSGANAIRDWNYRFSDAPHSLINTAYMRVKTISLAYRIPQAYCNRLGVQSIRIYSSGEDLFTFAKGTWGKSFDPEEGWDRADAFTYPFNKTISFGIDIQF